jgi:nuclear transport factor 2 (NTF2) superfamily protein
MFANEDFEFVNGFADRWAQAWNSHDTEQVLDCVSDDVIWEDLTFWPEIIHGKDAVRTYCDRIWETAEGLEFDTVERFFSATKRRGIWLFQMKGGPPAALAGKPRFELYGCDVFLEFDGDRLSHYRACYDLTETLHQMEMLPPRGGRTGGSYLLSLAAGALR